MFLDSFKMPPCVHKGREYSWCLVGVCILTKMIFLKEIYLNTDTIHKEGRSRTGQANLWCIYGIPRWYWGSDWSASSSASHTNRCRCRVSGWFQPRNPLASREAWWVLSSYNDTSWSESRKCDGGTRCTNSKTSIYAIQGAWKQQLEDHVAKTASTPKVFKPKVLVQQRTINIWSLWLGETSTR